MTELTAGLELELVPTDFSERCELLPAGDERAGATEAVALAGHLHVVDDGLKHGNMMYKCARYNQISG